MDNNTPRYYYIVRRAEDRVSFAARYYGPDLGWEFVAPLVGAEPYTAAELGEMLPAIAAARADLYIIPAEVGDCIASRNDDNGNYDWEEYEGDDDDYDAQSAWMQEQDVALCEAAALDLDKII